MSDTSDSNCLFSIKLASSAAELLDDWSTAGPAAIDCELDADLLMNGNFGAGPNSAVPIIRADHGRALLSVAHWGRNHPISPPEYFRLCVGQTLGYPGLIPATEVITKTELGPISVRPRERGHMYIGCIYFQASWGAPIDVVPLFLPAGPDISGHADFQPLLIPVDVLPRPGIWDFISPSGAPHLRKPLREGSLIVQPANRQIAALVSA
jgi:hypothetical protein